ncbi:MAG: hypothetical protein IPH31_25615 [Lewinellaceae bacterium]|nr:hypothetical protein [Lewinellaceae bacterium]
MQKYTSKNEKDVFDNYNQLTKVVSVFIVGLLAKVCFEEPIEESIGKDLEKIWNFEIGT